MILTVILLPGMVVVLYLATGTRFSAYPIAKITLTILPLVISLVFVALSKMDAHS